MFVATCRPSLLRTSAVVILALFASAPTTAQVPTTTAGWNKCELDCMNWGGSENLVKACKAACAAQRNSVAGTMVAPSAVLALPPTEAKPPAPAAKDRARAEKPK